MLASTSESGEGNFIDCAQTLNSLSCSICIACVSICRERGIGFGVRSVEDTKAPALFASC